jgi:N-acetylmuramoyl-L-alanine amidase
MISAAVMCLALNIYHEARGEPLAGQIAVGFNVMNRVASKRYPDTVCGVVKQARYHSWDLVNPIRHKCSYSWFCDGKDDFPYDDKAMLESVILAQNIYYEKVTDISEGATHYHANYVNPYWADSMDVVLAVGKHIFYR